MKNRTAPRFDFPRGKVLPFGAATGTYVGTSPAGVQWWCYGTAVDVANMIADFDDRFPVPVAKGTIWTRPLASVGGGR